MNYLKCSVDGFIASVMTFMLNYSYEAVNIFQPELFAYFIFNAP